MRTKGRAGPSARESEHLRRVKLLPCGVCGEGGGESAPSEAHHIKQGLHYLAIPLCEDCHRGGHNGLHGQARIWSVMRKDELSVLNDTVAALSA